MSERDGAPVYHAGDEWTPEQVRALRARLGLSQEAFARRIGTRQQTISEWETGARRPRRMSRRLLRMVAEESGGYAVPGTLDAGAEPES
jgi:DNA-binding transcriptional regulator YiaG